MMKKNLFVFLNNSSLVYVALVFPAVVLYLKSLSFDFTALDEQWQIVNNSASLSNFGSLKDAFLKPISGQYYRPLCYVSIFIDYQIGKLSPFFYHLSNLILHLVSVVLVFVFFNVSKVDRLTAFICALIFSVHPIMLHSVAWIVGRNDILLCIFSLASLIFLHKYFLSKQKHFFIFHLLFFCFALLSKENAIVLPLIFAASYFVFDEFKIKNSVIILLLWFCILVIWYIIRSKIVGSVSYHSTGFKHDMKDMGLAFLLFIGKAIFASQQSIMPTLQHSSIIPGLLAIVFIGLLAFVLGVKNRFRAMYGLFIFFIFLAIPIWFGVVKMGNEHYESRVYTSMVGMLFFFSQLNSNVNTKRVNVLITSVLLFYFVKTWIRMDVYRNSLSFAEAGINECPNYYLFYLHKADYLSKHHNFKEAILFYDKSIAIRPNYPVPYSNRGYAYEKLEQYTSAISDYSEAIRLSSSFEKKYYFNRCVAYDKIGDSEKAMKDLFILIACCRDIIPTEIEKTITKKWVALVEDLTKKIVVAPNNAQLFYKRAQLYLTIDMSKEAMQDLEKACVLDPLNAGYQLALKEQKNAM